MISPFQFQTKGSLDPKCDVPPWNRFHLYISVLMLLAASVDASGIECKKFAELLRVERIAVSRDGELYLWGLPFSYDPEVPGTRELIKRLEQMASENYVSGVLGKFLQTWARTNAPGWTVSLAPNRPGAALKDKLVDSELV